MTALVIYCVLIVVCLGATLAAELTEGPTDDASVEQREEWKWTRVDSRSTARPRQTGGGTSGTPSPRPPPVVGRPHGEQ